MESVACQTMTEGMECVLVDDCSTDDSPKVIADYIDDNYNANITFRLLRQERNQGPSAARNRGIREAKGEYIFFLDSDDTISPDCIELLHSLSKKYDADYVQGTYSSSNPPHINELPSFSDNGKEIKRLLLNFNKIPFSPHNRLVRRQMILDYDLFFYEQIKVREDFLWMTFVAKHVERFAYCDQPTYNRGYNADSLTNNINVDREILGYRVLIETMVENYDPFLLGCQKELALEALMMALRAGYYHDKTEQQHLIDVVMSHNIFIEKLLLKIYLKTNNPNVFHLLVRLYKKND